MIVDIRKIFNTQRFIKSNPIGIILRKSNKILQRGEKCQKRISALLKKFSCLQVLNKFWKFSYQEWQEFFICPKRWTRLVHENHEFYMQTNSRQMSLKSILPFFLSLKTIFFCKNLTTIAEEPNFFWVKVSSNHLLFITLTFCFLHIIY